MSDRLNVLQRIRYSIFPGTLQRPKYREGYRSFFNSLIIPFRPRNVQVRTLRFTLTWGPRRYGCGAGVHAVCYRIDVEIRLPAGSRPRQRVNYSSSKQCALRTADPQYSSLERLYAVYHRFCA